MNSSLAWPVAGFSGLALWGMAAASAGHRELWDVSSYWTMWLPLALLLSLLLGFLFPVRSWRWGVAVMLLQLPMAMLAGHDFGLMPLGATFTLVLSLPAIVAAAIGAGVRRIVSQ